MGNVFYDDSPEKRSLLLAALIMFSWRHPPVMGKYLRLLDQSPSDDFIEGHKFTILSALKYSVEFRSKLHNLFGLIVQDVIKQYVVFSKDYRGKEDIELSGRKPERHEYLRQAASPAGAGLFQYASPIVIRPEPEKGIVGGELKLFCNRTRNSSRFSFFFDDVQEAPYDLQIHFSEKDRAETEYVYLTRLSENNRNIIETGDVFGIIDYNRARGITIQRIDGIKIF
jgi:hypothetical protein